MATAVPDDVRVPPFDSLFEQRVFNRLIDRGYTVVPQIEAMGYRIDMVVTDWMTPSSFCEELEEVGLAVVRVQEDA